MNPILGWECEDCSCTLQSEEAGAWTNVRDAGIVALDFVAPCLVVFFLGFGQRMSAVADFLFPRM